MSDTKREKKKTVSTNMRFEPEIKEQAESIFRELGLSAGAAVELFYRQVILCRGLPFEVSLAPVNMEKNDFRKMDLLLKRGWNDLEMGWICKLEEEEISEDVRERIVLSDIAGQELDGIRAKGGDSERAFHAIIEKITAIMRDRRLGNTVFRKEPWRGRGVMVMSVSGYCIFYLRDGDVVKILRIIYFGIPSLQRIWDLGVD